MGSAHVTRTSVTSTGYSRRLCASPGRAGAILLLALTLATPAAALAAPRTYKIDSEATELVAITSPAGLMASFSSRHLLVARAIEGTVIYDSRDASRCRIAVKAPSEALEVDDPVRRKRYGLEKRISDAERAEVLAAVRSAAQLDVAAYPELSFVSRAVSGMDAQHLAVRGILTLHGVSSEVVVPVDLSTEGDLLTASGVLHITHAQFGMKPFSMALGTVRNVEAIELRLLLVAKETPARPPAPAAKVNLAAKAAGGKGGTKPLVASKSKALSGGKAVAGARSPASGKASAPGAKAAAPLRPAASPRALADAKVEPPADASPADPPGNGRP
jgi:polyisoprenoid-binding protein YceI